MALIYKGYQGSIPNKEGKKLYYPRLVKTGEIVDTQKLAKLISEKSTLTEGDVHNVVRNLMSVMREQLLNSKSVKLDGLGTFTMIARAGGNGVETLDEVSSTQITKLHCRFTPEYTRSTSSETTRALTEGATYIRLDKLTGTSLSTQDDDETESGSGGNSNSNNGSIDGQS